MGSLSGASNCPKKPERLDRLQLGSDKAVSQGCLPRNPGLTDLGATGKSYRWALGGIWG